MRKLLTTLVLTAAVVAANAGEVSAQWRNNGIRGNVSSYNSGFGGYNGVRAYTPYSTLYGNTNVSNFGGYNGVQAYTPYSSLYGTSNFNTGVYNSGYYSTPTYNTGVYNSGYYNTVPTYSYPTYGNINSGSRRGWRR